MGKFMLNLISVYAPQAGRPTVLKEEFLAMLDGVVSGIDSGERLLVCGDSMGIWCLRLIVLRVCMGAFVHAVEGHLRRDEHKGQVPQQVWLHGMYRGHIGPVPALIPEEHHKGPWMEMNGGCRHE